MSSVARPVLYAEDDENDVFLMQRAFQKVGVEQRLDFVENGQDALAYLGKALDDPSGSLLPQLILLDLKLPRITGLETLERIRREPRLAGVPVVLLTSSIQEKDTERARELGATAYLVKAPSFAQLTDSVTELRAAFLSDGSPDPSRLRSNRLPPA